MRLEDKTRRAKYVKSIQLEMVPQGKTMETIKNNGYIEDDMQRAEAIKNLYPAIDKYFVSRTEEGLQFLENFDYERYGKDKTGKARLKEDVIKHLEKAFHVKAGSGSFSNAKLIFEAIPSYLEKAGDTENAAELRSFKGCLALFSKYLITRATAVFSTTPERVVENMDTYMGNISELRRFLESGYAEQLSGEFRENGEIFSSPEGYGFAVTTSGIKAYNLMISGVVSEKKVEEKGVNMLISEANNEIKSTNTDERLFQKMKQLYKHALVPADKAFTVDVLKSDKDLRVLLQKDLEETGTMLQEIREDIFDYEASGMMKEAFIEGGKLHYLSNYVFYNHNKIPVIVHDQEREAIEKEYEGKINVRKEREKEKRLSRVALDADKKVYSIAKLQELMDKSGEEKVPISQKMMLVITSLCDKAMKAGDDLVANKIFEADTPLLGNPDAKIVIKGYFDAVTEVSRILRTLVYAKQHEATSYVNEKAAEYVADLKKNTNAHNKIRNYLTKKTEVAPKGIKMIFGQPSRLESSYYNSLVNNGAFMNKQNAILNMDGMYYLFMLTKGVPKIIFSEPASPEDTIRVLDVQATASNGALTGLPRSVFNEKGTKNFFETTDENVYIRQNGVKHPVTITREAYNIYKSGTFKTEYLNSHKGDPEAEKIFRRSKNIIIKTYKKMAEELICWSNFNFDGIKEADEYRDMKEYLDDVQARLTSMQWIEISREQIDALVENGEAMLFLIKNHNMYRDKEHGYEKDYPKTSYARIFLSALSDDNLHSMNLKLNSRPWFEFIPSIGQPKITHHKGDRTLNHYLADGRYLPKGPVYNELYQYVIGRISKEELSKEAYEAAFIKDEKGRETENIKTGIVPKDMIRKEYLYRDRFIIHMSYTMNVSVNKNTENNLVYEAEEDIKNGAPILSIARNEEDLIYYTVVKDGKIIAERSMNTIKGYEHINYHQMLKAHTEQKANNLQEWEYSSSAESIKTNYLKGAVKEIVETAIANEAVVVIEAVSDNKKRQGMAVDNQAYGKLKEMLYNSMSAYASYSGADNDAAPGGTCNPIQLTATALGHRPWNGTYLQVESTSATAAMDEESGFVNLIQLREYQTTRAKRRLLGSMDRIYSDGEKVVFSFNYEKIGIRTVGKNEWDVIACGERLLRDTKGKYALIDCAAYFSDITENIEGYSAENDLVPFIKDAPSSVINNVFELLRRVLHGHHNEDGQHYYVSPVNAKMYPYSRHTAYMLARKHLFRLEFNRMVEDAGIGPVDYQAGNEAWIAKMQGTFNEFFSSLGNK